MNRNFPVDPTKATTELCKLALKYGSDKTAAIFHSYTPYYHELLNARRDKVKRVLEIGIGFKSMMEAHTSVTDYRDGASLYMWRDYFPEAKITALDNNPDILIQDERIESFFCDQSLEASLDNFVRNCKNAEIKYDLIIDDGSHKAEDQALTAKVLMPLLADYGLYVIEDVHQFSLGYVVGNLPPYEVKDFQNPLMQDDRLIMMYGPGLVKPRPVTIVVLSKYKDILEDFAGSVAEKFGNGVYPVVMVRDSGDIVIDPEVAALSGWKVIDGPKKFSMAGNGNLGLRAVPPDHDVLYCGDDIRFLESHTIEKLQQVAYAHPEVGILSPQLKGRSSPALAYPQSACDYVRPMEMWFPCIYIKREVINKIGYLDERFNDFGSDDLDYNIRAELAGYKLAVTNTVAVEHEFDKESGGPTTFIRKLGKDVWEKQQSAAYEKLREKYGVSHAVMSHYLATKDLSVFGQQAEKVVKRDVFAEMSGSAPQVGPKTAPGSRRGLEGKSLFIMVPMRQPTQNFVVAWTHLILALQKFGVPCEFMFLNNESLVTRARDRLADYYRKKSSCTHALLVDDDIGFEAMDIVAMLDLDLEIAGAPCVKKSIRFDRVQDVILKNAAKNGGGRKLTPQELAQVAGDFILNFEKFEGKKSFNLGEPQAAHSVGTGLMMVRRDVFDRLAEVYSDRWYDSSRFDPSSLPGRTQDFFVAGVNYETRDYDSEDYRFCIEARKAGMSVWVLPWMKTTHCGAYVFSGDMQKMAELAPDWVL